MLCYNIACNTSQRSLLLPILYMLYLAKLLAQDLSLRFGYTNNICLYYATNSLNNNIRLLARNIQDVIVQSANNKIFFVLEKLEMIYLTRKARGYIPQCVVSNKLTISSTTTTPKEGGQLVFYQLGVQFDRKLSFNVTLGQVIFSKVVSLEQDSIPRSYSLTKQEKQVNNKQCIINNYKVK